MHGCEVPIAIGVTEITLAVSMLETENLQAEEGDGWHNFSIAAQDVCSTPSRAVSRDVRRQVLQSAQQ